MSDHDSSKGLSPKWNGLESTSNLGMIGKCYFPPERQEFNVIF